MGIVAVVGSINVDEVVRVERLPREGETVSGGTYQRFGGGKGANRQIVMDPAAIAGAPGVLLLSFEAPDEALCVAAEAARAGGWTIVVNPAPTRPIPQRLLAARPILIPNEHEAADLTGIPDPERAARVLQAMTGAPVIVTLGAAGALLLEGETATAVPAPEVDVVDTTGAGDCLCGTLAAQLAAGDALSLAVERAVAAASLSTTTPGAR